MNLIQLPRQLSSPIPRSQNELLAGSRYDLFRVLYWSLWSPPTLIAYTEQLLKTHLINAETKQSEISPLYHLRLLALVSALLIVLSIGLIFTILLILFQLSNPLPSLMMIGGSAIAAVCAVLLTYGVCRLLIQDLSLGMVTILTLGTANGLLSGLAVLASNPEAAEFRATLVGICFGGLFGLLISTFSYYLLRLRSAETYKFIFVLTLNFIIWATFFFLSIPFTWGTIAIAVVLGILALAFASLRLDDWILSLLFNYRTKEFNSFYFSQVSPLPSDTLARNLLHWLDVQWDEVIPLLPSFVAHRGQKKVVFKAINQALDDLQKDKDLLKKSEQIYAFYIGENLLPKHNSRKKYIAQNTQGAPVAKFLSIIQNLFSWRKLQSAHERKEYRKELVLQSKDKTASKRLGLQENNLLHSSMQGFHYLTLKQPKAAKEAFEKVTTSDYRDEMSKIAGFLADLLEDEQISDNPPLKIPKKPRFPAHKATWDIFERLQKIVRYMWILRSCREPNSFRSVVIDLDDEFGELNGYLEGEANHAEIVNFSEKELILPIIKDWENEFIQFVLSFGIWHEIRNQSLHSNLRNVTSSNLPPNIRAISEDGWRQYFEEMCRSNSRSISVKPVKANPFAFEEPLSAHRGIFVGRKSQLDQIQAAWEIGNFQPLLLTGQRLSGKTSLLRQADLKSKTKMDVAYINLHQFEGRFSINKILLWIADSVAEHISFSTIGFDQSSNDPEHAFRQFIHACCSYTGDKGLVIVLDGFEYIEQFMLSQVVNRLMHFLWALAETEPSLGIVFSTISVEAEINQRYDTPFSETLRAVEVGLLNQDEVKKLLQEPSPSFLPFVTDQTVEVVYNLTHGQPFLTQLIGHHLVELFNEEAKAQTKQRTPLITPDDLTRCLLSDSLFHKNCRRYYMGILREANNVHQSAERLLRKLSEEPSGMSKIRLEQDLQTSIDTVILHLLEGHNIIEQTGNDWRITVELFRLWLCRQRINP